MLSSFVKSHMLSLSGLLMTGGLLTSCQGETPDITDTTVTPSSFAISSFADDVQFTIHTTVLHLGGTITSVKATVEDEGLSYDLVQQGTVVGGEEWSITTTLTLWAGFSEGTYYIDITATSDGGETVTKAHAATVTVTS